MDVSPDIILTEIDKNFKINYPDYSRSILFEPPFYRNLSNPTRNLTIECVNLKYNVNLKF